MANNISITGDNSGNVAIAGKKGTITQGKTEDGPSVATGKHNHEEKLLFEVIACIDLCDSTVLLKRYGKKCLAGILEVLGDFIEEETKASPPSYKKDTGDGCILGFSDTLFGVQSMVRLLQRLTQFNLVCTEKKQIHLRIGMDCGEILQRSGNERTGDPIVVAKRIEGLQSAHFPTIPDGALPVQDRILVTTAVRREINSHISTQLLGQLPLKGFEGTFAIYRVMLPS